MKDYTIMLLRPDYMASTFGQDTFTAWVKGKTLKAAVKSARKAASFCDEVALNQLDDYFVLAIFEGHLNNLSNDEEIQ